MQYKKGDKTSKQATTTLQATCLHLQRFREGKEVRSSTFIRLLSCDIKGKPEQSNGI